jgi:adenylosuccinate synthase
MGNGMLVDVVALRQEAADIESKGFEVSPERLLISSTAHLAMPHHKLLDELREVGTAHQGSTKRGISFGYAEKYGRDGIQAAAMADPAAVRAHAARFLEKIAASDIAKVNHYRSITFDKEGRPIPPFIVGNELDKLEASAARFAPFVGNSLDFMDDALAENKRVLAEGAQSTWLDIDISPYRRGTSSHTTAAGACVGLSIAPHVIGEVYGVAKAIKSRVGDGPFVTEIFDEDQLAKLRGPDDAIYCERGKSTGRDRRLGFLDLPEIRRAVAINHVTRFLLTKVDQVPEFGPTVQVARAYELDGRELMKAPTLEADLVRSDPIYKTLPTWYEDIGDCQKVDQLPRLTREYLGFVSSQLGIKIDYIGVGANEGQIITC